MKERPIIFSAPMVRAILAGTKTQTRRVVKPMRDPDFGCELSPGNIAAEVNGETCRVRAPYGQRGDRLWVREAWDFLPDGDSKECMIRYFADGAMEQRHAPSTFNPMIYGRERKRPPIHMPRWASRILLEISAVRVERLHDISEADAQAEGVERVVAGSGWRRYSDPDSEEVGVPPCADARSSFRSLWEHINGEKSWRENPWVWVVKFCRL